MYLLFLNKNETKIIVSRITLESFVLSIKKINLLITLGSLMLLKIENIPLEVKLVLVQVFSSKYSGRSSLILYVLNEEYYKLYQLLQM